MLSSLKRLFFPDKFRTLPHRRLILNIFRSLHIMCFSIVVGGIFFDQPHSLLSVWLLGVVATGVALFMVDLYGSCIALFEVRGVSVLLKVALLFYLPFMQQEHQFGMLVVLVIFSSFISHSTRRIRHKNLLPLSWQQKLNLGIEDDRRVNNQ